MMKGWKTWAAAIGLAILGVVDIANEDFDSGFTKLGAAMGLVGLGHKIEKAIKALNLK